MDYLAIDRCEVLVAVIVPATQAISVYDKIRVRGAIDFPLAGVAVSCIKSPHGARQYSIAITGTNSKPVLVDVPPFEEGDDEDGYFAKLEKLVQKGVSPQRTTTIAPHYRRLSVAAVTARLARDLL